MPKHNTVDNVAVTWVEGDAFSRTRSYPQCTADPKVTFYYMGMDYICQLLLLLLPPLYSESEGRGKEREGGGTLHW